MRKLHTTVDFGDEIGLAGKRYSEDNLRDMFRYCKQLGISRLYWIYDDWNSLYKEPFGSHRNLFQFVTETCHDAGMEFYALIKPFETGMHFWCLPPYVPWVRKLPHAQGLSGPYICAAPFLIENPASRGRRSKAPTLR